MLDFLIVSTRRPKKDTVEIYPKFSLAVDSTDLMTRGKDFYAIWNEDKKLWSTSESIAIRLIDRELDRYYEEHKDEYKDDHVKVMHMWDTDSGSIDRFHKFVQKQMRENCQPLDETIIFGNVETTKESYASRKLSYSLGYEETPAYTELSTTLYSSEELHKLEWAIGSIISGDSKYNQKFVVMYGPPASGKSTMIGIVEKLFDGYCKSFDAKALGSNGAFPIESLLDNPLVAIQHDGDLSHIEDNTRLNSIVSHEHMTVNEKYKSAYTIRFNSFLIMGTNKPVKITDAKSGIIRRLIDISPSGKKIPYERYKVLMEQINHELGGIAGHCLKVYEANKGAYENYVPVTMLGASNDFYNFVLESYDIFKEQDGTTLKAAWEMYKSYCEEAKVGYPLPLRAFKEELKNYFRNFSERAVLEDEVRARNYYSSFIFDKFMGDVVDPELYTDSSSLKLSCKKSLLDDILKDCPAQYGVDRDEKKEVPAYKWENVKTTLKDIKTTELHYVLPPENMIVVDFDLKDESGNKSFKLNAKAAAKWPPTYAELSKGGNGIHLHYIYTGDVSKLSSVYDQDIEIKVFTGNSSLRRKLSKCNDIPVATISSGLPLKKEKPLINQEVIRNEKGIRTLIKRNLNKEIHPGTKPSIDFIFKILDDAYKDGIQYDVTDMRPAVLSFAAGSTHQAEYCIKLVNKMQFKSESDSENQETKEKLIIFFDVEVFPNLFVVVWKAEGKNPVELINPTPAQIEDLLKFNLVGFNNRRYDNHILYARLMGYSNEQLFMTSQKIINGQHDAFFGEAYNLSYTDIYDFSSIKQSLKKFEIELGIHHQELGLPWDQPVDESMWQTVADYCVNDVVATEAVWNNRKEDFMVRQILASLSGLTVNDTTRMHTTKIIFGDNKHPNLKYTDLSEMFPGYTFENGKSSYMGEDPGEGGYVYAEPGIYSNVALLDIASMHPSSIIALDLFGDYTCNFKDLLDARVCIKHRDFDRASTLLNGALKPFLKDVSQADSLAKALKLALNSVYGYTTATFDNPFKDIRNKDNIVAKRGSLFMINLKHEVQKRGYTVAHIKTDSIKIPNADQKIIDFVMEYGKQYGYNFEHEATYDRMCLVNDAVYIAKYNEQGVINKGGKQANEWTATGAQFQVPYVFKSLFAKQPILFEDMCETKTVTSALYLDFNEDLPEGEHKYHFVGKAGRFTPMISGAGGGELLREKDGKYYSATGAKGYRWMESEVLTHVAEARPELLDMIDISYYQRMCDAAIDTIRAFGDYEQFVAD